MNPRFRGGVERPNQHQQQVMPMRGRSMSLGAVIKEKDDELALFLEMRKREKEQRTNPDLHLNLNPPPGSKPGSSPIFKIAPAPRKTAVDEFLNSDADKNDYDWLLTPPGTPLFPSLDKDKDKDKDSNSKRSPTGTPKPRQTMLRSRLANLHDPPTTTRGSTLSRHSPSLSTSSSSSYVGARRPSSSGGSAPVSSRPATPTGRSTLPAASRSSRPSTPTSRATLPSRPVAPPRSSTPVRSSTPTSRSSTSVVPPNRPPSRPATPTRRPTTPSGISANSAQPMRTSSVAKTAPVASKVPSRGSSPTVRSRPWKPSEMPGFSLDPPPNLRTSLSDRPTSASRGRPGAPSSRSSSVEAGSVGRPRRQSCSPARGRAPNGSVHSGSSVPAVGRSRATANDNVNPVLLGNKMVGRVISARRLAPPKQDNLRCAQNNSASKSSLSPDSSGFGRSLSKKSLDMAMRHMDIRRSIPNNLRPLMTNIPASSMYSVRTGSARSRGVSVSDSPLATSSNASSEQSVNNNNLYLDISEAEDGEIRAEKAEISPRYPVAR